MEDNEPNNEKQPIEMSTDEALDYVFGQQLAEALKQEAQQPDTQETCSE